jgi:predicted TIM-barrel fold metal-dependent hydrolase
MKLSGAYSEMGFTSASLPVDQVVQRVSPWFDHTLQAFGAKRILFGSDWPISTGANKAWASWKDVVAELMRKANLSDEDKDRIWRGTAAEAYRI